MSHDTLKAEASKAEETAPLHLLLEVERLRRDNDLLRAALEEVEWPSISYSSREYATCPWCKEYRDQGHAPDCQRQLALKVNPRRCSFHNHPDAPLAPQCPQCAALNNSEVLEVKP